jgi:hypothetical protein
MRRAGTINGSWDLHVSTFLIFGFIPLNLWFMMYDQPMIELIRTFLTEQELASARELLFLGMLCIPEALCNVNRWQLSETMMLSSELLKIQFEFDDDDGEIYEIHEIHDGGVSRMNPFWFITRLAEYRFEVNE